MFATCDDMLFSESIPAIPFVKSKPPYQKLELPESRVGSAISALDHGCIMPIPSLQLQKKTCHMQRSRGSGHGVVISKKCYKS